MADAEQTPKAGSTLSTKIEGNYELRYIGTVKTNLPIVLVKKRVLETTDESQENKDFNVYPNPTNSIISIYHGTMNNGIIEINDLNGQMIGSFTIQINSSSMIDVSTFDNGIYFLTVKSNGNVVYTSRFAKQ